MTCATRVTSGLHFVPSLGEGGSPPRGGALRVEMGKTCEVRHGLSESASWPYLVLVRRVRLLVGACAYEEVSDSGGVLVREGSE